MYKLFDWECLTKDCPESAHPVEHLTKDHEEIMCHACGAPMRKMMPAPIGYVSPFDAARFRKGSKKRR